MADNQRARKVADRIKEVAATMIDRRLKDPRLGMVTLTDVRVTGDLQHATIFYTVYGDEAELKATGAALASARGMIRSEIGKQLGLRLTPTIEFVPDALPATAQSIEDALVAARNRDARLAEIREGAQPAGEANPYREDEPQTEQSGEAESGPDEADSE